MSPRPAARTPICSAALDDGSGRRPAPCWSPTTRQPDGAGSTVCGTLRRSEPARLARLHRTCRTIPATLTQRVGLADARRVPRRRSPTGAGRHGGAQVAERRAARRCARWPGSSPNDRASTGAVVVGVGSERRLGARRCGLTRRRGHRRCPRRSRACCAPSCSRSTSLPADCADRYRSDLGTLGRDVRVELPGRFDVAVGQRHRRRRHRPARRDGGERDGAPTRRRRRRPCHRHAPGRLVRERVRSAETNVSSRCRKRERATGSLTGCEYGWHFFDASSAPPQFRAHRRCSSR